MSDGLDLIAAHDLRYRRELRDGVVVLRSIHAWSDPDNPLNRPAPALHWGAVTTDQALAGVLTLMGGTELPPSPLPPSDGRVFAVEVPAGTTLDVLVAVARAPRRGLLGDAGVSTR